MVSADIAKRLIARHKKPRSQPASDWSGTFPIPPAIEQFYREIGPANVTIESYGNPFFLPSLKDLWKYQAGYRWHGLTGEPNSDWPDDWVAVADEVGGAFIFVRSSGAILHSLHGAGKWNAKSIFSDLNTMAACLALLGVIVLDAGDEFLDDDSTLRPESRKFTEERLRELLGPGQDPKSVLALLGWVD